MNRIKFDGIGVVQFLFLFLAHIILILPSCSLSSLSICDAFSVSSASVRVAESTRKTTTTKTVAINRRRTDDDDQDLVKEQLGYLPLNYHSVSARTSKFETPVAIKTYPLLRKKKKNDKKSSANNDDGTPLTLSSMSGGVFAPFPTQYWLTCPTIGRAIGEIERQGYIGLIEDYLNLESNADKRHQLWSCHEQSGIDRWEALTPTDRQFFIQYSDTHSTVARMKDILCNSGIAGTAYRQEVVEGEEEDDNHNDGQEQKGVGREVSIKCLHTHYAHFRSTTTTNTGSISNHHQCNETGSPSTTHRQEGEVVENPIGRIVHHLLQTNFPTLDL